jgi:hypothetical protein
MIMDLNKIRTMKTLTAIQKPLREFVTFDRTTMVSVYTEDLGWSEDDYDADKEQAEYLLEQVDHRMKSLGHYLAKAGKNVRQPPSPHETPESASSV